MRRAINCTIAWGYFYERQEDEKAESALLSGVLPDTARTTPDMTLFRMLFGRSYVRPEADQDGVHDRNYARNEIASRSEHA